MALEKSVLPYEFLARWKDGALSGVHVQFVTVLKEDGVIISQTPGDVLPIGEGIPKGFPMADILQKLHVDAIALSDTSVSEKLAAEKSAEDSRERVAAVEAALDSAIKALTAIKISGLPKPETDTVK